MNFLRRELEYFFGAVRFFTRLPVPGWVPVWVGWAMWCVSV